MSNNFYIDIHVLQTVPPSCVNRDDTGSPKTAIYGGVTRARVSSQAWKRAIRMTFDGEIGIRTKQVLTLISEEIMKKDPSKSEQEAIDMAKNAWSFALNPKKETKRKKKDTDAQGKETAPKEVKEDVLRFISRTQAATLATLICDGEKTKDKYAAALKDDPTADIVLFGRMVAENSSLNYDAAVQVAHSISTHEVRNEFDYFTAVDDLGDEDSAGAGHIGTTEFNSSTLYRYATVNVREVEKWLAEDTPHAIRDFVSAFLCSMPTGKQNSFANRTAPDCVYVTVRRDQPVNLVGAFEKPIRSRDGYVAASETALAKYAEETYDRFVDKPALAFCVSRHGENWADAENLGRDQLLERVENAVREACKYGEVD